MGLYSKVGTPAAKQEKQAAAHVIRQKIPLKRSCQHQKSWSGLQISMDSSVSRAQTDCRGEGHGFESRPEYYNQG